jgi:hypothetical protein
MMGQTVSLTRSISDTSSASRLGEPADGVRLPGLGEGRAERDAAGEVVLGNSEVDAAGDGPGEPPPGLEAPNCLVARSMKIFCGPSWRSNSKSRAGLRKYCFLLSRETGGGDSRATVGFLRTGRGLEPVATPVGTDFGWAGLRAISERDGGASSSSALAAALRELSSEFRGAQASLGDDSQSRKRPWLSSLRVISSAL